MADVTLKVGSELISFPLCNHHMEIYGSSERDQKWLVVISESLTNPNAMLVIWYDKKTCYARIKNESVARVHTEIGYTAEDGNIFLSKDNDGNTFLQDGDGNCWTKDSDGYFPLRELHGNTYRRDEDGNMYIRNGDERVHLRNGDEVQVTKGSTNLKFNIFFGEEQKVTKGNNGLPTATTSTENWKHHPKRMPDNQDTCWKVQDHTDNIEPGRRHGCQTIQKAAKLQNKMLYSNVLRTGNMQLTSDNRQTMNVSDRVIFFEQGKRGMEQSVGHKKRHNLANFNTNGKRFENSHMLNDTNVGQIIPYIPRENPSPGVPIKGIANMGLTCYANGIIQILAQTELFLKNVRSNDKLRMPLAYSLSRVLREINKPSNQTVVERKNVQKIFEIIEEDRSFVSRSSNDCLEFLMYIFERLNRESKENISMFQIKLQNVIHASPCGHFELCDMQLSYHLLIPLYRETNDIHPSVKSGLRKLLKDREIFSGQELPCRRCYKEKALENDTSHKSLAISHAPELLILQIGRVETSQHSKFLQKQDAFIQYDRQLAIDEEHWGPDGKPDRQQRVYQLYGVVSHNGSVSFGHYACYVKKTHTSQWFHCNDSTVTFVDEEMVLNDSDAFLLFYEKIETVYTNYA